MGVPTEDTSLRKTAGEDTGGAAAGGKERLPEQCLVRFSKSKLKARRWKRELLHC